MATNFMCELCHKEPAKKQWFDENDRELYICSDCFEENDTEVFEKVLASINSGSDEIHDEVSENGFMFSTGSADDPLTKAYIQRLAGKLLEVGDEHRFRQRTIHGENIHVEDWLNSKDMNFVIHFSPKEKEFTLAAKIDVDEKKDDNPTCSCTFNVADPENITMEGIISESSFDMSKANYFPLNGMYPPWLFSILTTVVSAIVKANEDGILGYSTFKP